jgi:hypothetical protein
MIARTWKGAVRKQDGDAYARYMQETGVAGYAKSPGNNGVWMLRRDVDDRTEFVMFTLWDWLEAVKAFAGRTRRRLIGAPLDAQARLPVFHNSPPTFRPEVNCGRGVGAAARCGP